MALYAISYNTLSAPSAALTENVYPMLDTMLNNLPDSLGEVSALLLDLNGILGKTTPIVKELGNTFGAVNNALIQSQGITMPPTAAGSMISLKCSTAILKTARFRTYSTS